MPVSKEFLGRATAVVLTAIVGGCAHEAVDEKGVGSSGWTIPVLGGGHIKPHFDRGVRDTYEIGQLRKSANPVLSEIGESAACETKGADKSRLDEGDEISNARLRARGLPANGKRCP